MGQLMPPWREPEVWKAGSLHPMRITEHLHSVQNHPIPFGISKFFLVFEIFSRGVVNGTFQANTSVAQVSGIWLSPAYLQPSSTQIDNCGYFLQLNDLFANLSFCFLKSTVLSFSFPNKPAKTQWVMNPKVSAWQKIFKESADGFVLLKEVLDPTKGWLENDSLVVESWPKF